MGALSRPLQFIFKPHTKEKKGGGLSEREMIVTLSVQSPTTLP